MSRNTLSVGDEDIVFWFTVECGSEDDPRHTIYVLKPGCESKCEKESSIIGPTGYVICLQDHDIEIDETISDLTGLDIPCLKAIADAGNYLVEGWRGKHGIGGRMLAICLGHEVTRAVLRSIIEQDNSPLVYKLARDHLIDDDYTLQDQFHSAMFHNSFNIARYMIKEHRKSLQDAIDYEYYVAKDNRYIQTQAFLRQYKRHTKRSESLMRRIRDYKYRNREATEQKPKYQVGF
ncbi:MAG: hypothetical protein WCV79_04145 [Candidatus Paceibacterota bacterium]|jgi:hypothetical protein